MESMNSPSPSTTRGAAEYLNNARRGHDGFSAQPYPPPQVAPRRRENAIQPPALTTSSLSGVRYQVGAGGGGFLPTPSTTTPAAMASPSPFMPPPPSSSTSSQLSGMSPSIGAQHHQSPYAAPYNPQEWGPIGRSPNVVGMGVMTPATTPMSSATSRGMSDESGLPPPPPPPPYSPPRSTAQAPSHASSSASPVQSNTSPAYHRNNASPVSQQQQQQQQYPHTRHPPFATSRRRPSSMIHSQDLPSAGAGANHGPPPDSNGQATHGVPLPSSSRSGNAYFPTTGRANYANNIPPGRTSPDMHSTSYVDPTGPMPPGSRRASSTGDIGSRTVPDDIGSQSSSRRWEPGMPLPPPPPGPPPGSSPSSRRTAADHSVWSSGGRERPQRTPTSGTRLPTVPPTPAGWIDTPSAHQTSDEPQSTTAQSASVPAQHTNHDASRSSTPESHDVGADGSNRILNAKAIRERRVETRLGKAENVSPKDDVSASASASTNRSDPPWPADLVLQTTSGPGLVRRRTLTKGTPRSARSNPSDDPKSGTMSSTSPFGQRTSSTGSFPTPTQQEQPTSGRSQQQQQQQQQPRQSPSQHPAQTPPFSPGRGQPSPVAGEVPHSLPPKTLPTPPVSVQHEASPNLTALSPQPAGRDRPISHLLHIPIDASPTHVPLVPERSSSSLSGQRQQTGAAETKESFVQDAERRYQDYLTRESEAPSDTEALHLFCEFVIAESAIRRKRYESVWTADSFDLAGVVDRLFKLPPPRKEQVTREPDNNDTQDENDTTAQHPPASPYSPQTKPALKVQPNVEPAPWNHYRPTLSPIASMSMSNDEMSSRGRAPSRWWESQTGSDSGGAQGAHAPRPKRETKYMGLPREMREAMQLQAAAAIPEHEVDDQSVFPSTNPFANYGPNEYPPEKVGWHEEGLGVQPALTRVPSTGQGKLDVSRLVTLPPPYPRHYPAVNNNHPDLSFYRSTVRSVSDLSEIKTAKENYELKVKDLREKHEQRLKDERLSFKTGINRGIEEGSISYADAAEAETIRRSEEHDQEKELVQAEFDLFQERVFKPMRGVLGDRINIVSKCIDELRGKVFASAQHETPNQTQEGGDEQPELLEKLTQLKWLFEARENLYREQFELQSEHSEKYRTLVTLPYHQTKNQEKIQETDKFFARDSQDQKLAFATGTLRRFESFLEVIEDNVARGAETQLSAFWDIAPSLLDLLQQVPEDLRVFAIRIPQKEYDENPSYYRFPLQYLYSLVSHSEKSTFQFIEAQTNLFCLLHEVKSGHLAAECLCTELQRLKSDDDESASLVRSEMRQSRDESERRLTADLKEKVGMVEQQWAEALGKVLEGVKWRVQEWLSSHGGWEEMMQMEQA